ncbi:hypothetical protein TNCV_3610101 [Trichonephila clavipes]|nr:hypothetical protein TNCV_3610101 [Trichonephila clavipes]
MYARMTLQMVWPVRTVIKILHLVATLLFQKLLHESNKISNPLGGIPSCMSGMKEIVLVLLCFGQAVGEMKLYLLGEFRSGHTRSQRHVAGLKVYPSCPNSNVTQAPPAHILTCTGCRKRLSSPVRVLQRLKTYGFMDQI